MLAKKISIKGFALPTVLLASTILLTVLTVAVVAAASVNTAVGNTYYQQLAREAAESGLAYARYCYNQVGADNIAKNGNLTQATDCYGTPKSGQNCANSPGTSLCGLVDNGSIRTQFSVEQPITDSGSASYTLHATGLTQLLRSGNHAVYDTIDAPLSQQVSLNLNGIASGNDTTCTIQNGQLYCWGKNDSGQVGNGTTNSPVTVPYHVQGFPPVGGVTYNYVQYVATGISHTCAVVGTDSTPTDGNQVYCWGDNSLGQLGTGNTTSSLSPVPGASGLAAGRVVGCNTANPNCTPISARDHTCIMAEPGTGSSFSSVVEYCWGQDNYGQAGQVTTADQTTIPPGGIKTSVGVSMYKQGGGGIYYITSIGNTSGEFACLINGTALGQTSGGVYCWGHNYYGELGNGTRSSTATQMYATPVSNLTSNVTKITTNNSKACALQSANLYCWGGNGPSSTVIDYRLDSGSAVSGSWYVPTPVKLVSSGQYGGPVTDFAITDWNTCIVAAGKVYCSGYNDLGQLGQGTTSGPAHGAATSASQVRSAGSMVQVKGALNGQTVTSITSGNNHFCAITTTHDAYCWGDNSLGQLGNGTTDNSATPTKAHVPATVIY